MTLQNKPLVPHIRAKILELARNGEKREYIALLFNMTKGRVSGICWRAGIRQRPSRLPDTIRKSILHYIVTHPNIPYSTVCKVYGVNENTISKIAIKAGIRRHPFHRRSDYLRGQNQDTGGVPHPL